MPSGARGLAVAALGPLVGLALLGPTAAAANPPPPMAVGTRPALARPRSSAPAAAGPVAGAVSEPLASGTLGHRLREYFTRASTIVLLVVLVLCSLVLVLIRRRSARVRERARQRTAGEQ